MSSALGDATIYSATGRHFGRKKISEFLPFWGGTNTKGNSLNKKKVNDNSMIDTLIPFTAIDVKNIEDIKPHTISMLKDALGVVAVEYFKNEAIKKKQNKNEAIIYYGKQVMAVFSREIDMILGNSKKCLPHIVLFDLIPRLELADFFLRDALLDLSREDSRFELEYLLACDIVSKWTFLYESLQKQVKEKNIKHSYVRALLPNEKLIKENIFDKKTLKNIFKNANEISMLQNKLFNLLLKKLKTDK